MPDAKKSSPGRYVNAADAYKRLVESGSKALLVDIRSRAEVAFLGMPTIAVANIPWQVVGSFNDGYAISIRRDFADPPGSSVACLPRLVLPGHASWRR